MMDLQNSSSGLANHHQNVKSKLILSPQKHVQASLVTASATSAQGAITSDNAASTTSAFSSPSSSLKQASSFKRGWLKGRQHWLKFVEGEGMFCELCIKHDKLPVGRETWNTIPCTRYRLQNITKHEGTVAHCDSVK